MLQTLRNTTTAKLLIVCSDCHQQSLEEQFIDADGKTEKNDAKLHLSKFLDVTRSDMLFADKVILVEGIAEKLLMPLFMDACGCSYEDEHISIVEIGGKHFEYFIELSMIDNFASLCS